MMKTDEMVLALLNGGSPAGRLQIVEDIMERFKKLEAVAETARSLRNIPDEITSGNALTAYLDVKWKAMDELLKTLEN